MSGSPGLLSSHLQNSSATVNRTNANSPRKSHYNNSEMQEEDNDSSAISILTRNNVRFMKLTQIPPADPHVESEIRR